MVNFFKKIYNIFLQQNGWWLEQFQSKQSQPMLLGLSLFFGYIIILSIFSLTPPTAITGFVMGISFILFSVTGILWIRDDKFPLYIIGIFKVSSHYQRVQAIFWVIFWGIMGLAIIIASFVE